MIFFRTNVRRSSASGFTLIEMAIVLVLMSLALTTALSFWRIHVAGQGLSSTRENMRKAELALHNYVAMNGYYPCPASRLAKKGDDDWGRALPDCRTDLKNDTTKRTVAAKGRDDEYIRIGILPFRSLGLPDMQAQDGWGNLLQYAVTEKLTTPATFHQRAGAIDVVAEDKKSRFTPPASAQYIILSTGADGAGGYSNGAKQVVACPKNLLETQNCDDDAAFLDTEQQLVTAKGAKAKKGTNVYAYDDHILYLQYDPALHDKAGLTYYFADSCPQGFEEVVLAEGTLASDVETLTTYSQVDPRYKDQQYTDKGTLCGSNMYSQKMEIRSPPMNEGEVKSNCPKGWTTIGYAFFASGVSINREICAR